MQPGEVSENQASLKRQRETLFIADSGKRRCKVDCDILECPLCSEPFSTPVYQCENGHMACPSCCKKIKKCPTCTQPIGHIRNLAVEKMIEVLDMDCKNAHHGCKSVMKSFQREEHETSLCEHRIIHCPVPGHQLHRGPKNSIPTHLMAVHGAKIEEFSEATRSVSFNMKASDEYVMLKSRENWFLLHCAYEKPCESARIYCVGFASPEKAPLYTMHVPYQLTVEAVKNNRQHTVIYSMHAVTVDYRCVNDWNFNYLVLPRLRTDKCKRDFTVTVSLV